ncbi:hypothetical protein TNCV_105741 [Trichonephila clavipes]|nr:hypothetical protein TNCV_105741 [Trichonephila clavipes]
MAELVPLSGVSLVSGWTIFVHHQGYIQGSECKISVQRQENVFVHEAQMALASGVCPESRRVISGDLDAKYLSCVTGMSSVLEEEFCPASDSPGGRTLSCVRRMYSVRVKELCPVSGLYPVVKCKISVQRQGNVLCSGGTAGSSDRGISRVLDAEPCTSSDVCPVSEWQNSV